MSDSLVHQVIVEPVGLVLHVPDGKTLMSAATGAGVRWPSVCGGLAECGVCHVEVISSDEEIPPPSAIEASMLRRSRLRPKMNGEIRLACQLPITTRTVVHKRGVRASVEATPETKGA